MLKEKQQRLSVHHCVHPRSYRAEQDSYSAEQDSYRVEQDGYGVVL